VICSQWIPRRLSCEISRAWSNSWLLECWPAAAGGSESAGSLSADTQVLGRGLVARDRLPAETTWRGWSDEDDQPTSSSWLLLLRAAGRERRGDELRWGLTAGLDSLGDLLLNNNNNYYYYTLLLHYYYYWLLLLRAAGRERRGDELRWGLTAGLDSLGDLLLNNNNNCYYYYYTLLLHYYYYWLLLLRAAGRKRRGDELRWGLTAGLDSLGDLLLNNNNYYYYYYYTLLLHYYYYYWLLLLRAAGRERRGDELRWGLTARLDSLGDLLLNNNNNYYYYYTLLLHYYYYYWMPIIGQCLNGESNKNLARLKTYKV